VTWLPRMPPAVSAAPSTPSGTGLGGGALEAGSIPGSLATWILIVCPLCSSYLKRLQSFKVWANIACDASASHLVDRFLRAYRIFLGAFKAPR
jgi:hypothetical protein